MSGSEDMPFKTVCPVLPPRRDGALVALMALLLGAADRVPLKVRVLNAYLLLAMVIGILGAITDSLSNMHPGMVFMVLSYTFLEGLFYYCFRVRGRLLEYQVPALVLMSTFLVPYWLAYDGSYGSAPYLFFLPALLPVWVARGWQRVTMLVVYISVAVSLFCVEYFFPDLVQRTMFDEGQRVLDLVSTHALVFIALVALTVVLAGAYDDARELVEAERRRADQLLLNVMPATILAELKRRNQEIARYHEAVSVLFADIVGFTSFAAQREPDQVVAMLNRLFTRFDQICTVHGLEKIKIIGDRYMAAAGVPEEQADHAIVTCRAALAMRQVIQQEPELSSGLQIRIGIHSGPVVAGILHATRLAYDLWGDAVNVASRMESGSEAGRIRISDATRLLLGDRFLCEAGGTSQVKGKGQMTIWWLTSEKVGAG